MVQNSTASENGGGDSFASPSKLDPRDPDYSRSGIFVYHNCYKCHHGAKPCVRGGSHNCEYPHARDD